MTEKGKKDCCSRSNGKKSSQGCCCRTPHPLHDGAQDQAGARLKHQDFAASVHVCQGQHLGQRVVAQVAASHINTPHFNCCKVTIIQKNRHTILTEKKKWLTHQIFPGSLPWYIIARTRQEGFRTVTVLSYLGHDQDGNERLKKEIGHLFRFERDSLLLFLLNVLVLGVFRLIFERRAVIYKLLNDFL